MKHTRTSAETEWKGRGVLVGVVQGRDRDDTLASYVIESEFVYGVGLCAVVVVVAALLTWRSQLVRERSEPRASHLHKQTRRKCRWQCLKHNVVVLALLMDFALLKILVLVAVVVVVVVVVIFIYRRKRLRSILRSVNGASSRAAFIRLTVCRFVESFLPWPDTLKRRLFMSTSSRPYALRREQEGLISHGVAFNGRVPY